MPGRLDRIVIPIHAKCPLTMGLLRAGSLKGAPLRGAKT